MVLGGRSDAASDGLQEQTDEVAGAENDGVRARPEPGEVGAVDNDDTRQAEVDGGAQESRGDGQGDEIHEKIIAVEWVEVHPDTSDVTNEFKKLKGPVSEWKITNEEW